MADKETPSLDRSLQQMRFGESITFVDDIVCSDGPVFLGGFSAVEQTINRPLVALECMAQELPLVPQNVSSSSTLCEHAAMRRLFNKVDCKDLADLVMKLPVSAVVARFANAPQEAEKRSLEILFQECFYSGFPDIIEWIPPDLAESLPSWLTDTCPGVPEATRLTPSLRQKTPYNLTPSSPRVLPDISVCPTYTYGLPSPVLPGEKGDTATVKNSEIMGENEFARRAVLLWAKLGRKTRRTVKTGSPIGSEASDNKIVSSSVHVPWGFIVPGGRFREMYYWDSYWIVRGLLHSGMISTARGIILNFADLVRRFGFIPNGNRSYYLTRSQPPVFSMMLSAYYAFTGDLELIRDTYLYVQREYFYWMEGDLRQVHVTLDGRDLQLNRYLGHIAEPRTESWDTDETVVRTAAEKALQNGNHEFSAAARSCILQNIRAAAESGWDFSSRWVPDDVDAVTEGVMPALRSESFLPVDLNSFLYHSELYLLYFGRVLNQFDPLCEGRRAPEYFLKCATDRRDAMLQLLWNDEASWWFDFDISKGRQSTRITSAGVVPLLMQIHSSVNVQACRLFGFECSSSGHAATCTCHGITLSERKGETTAHKRQISSAQFLVEKSGLWDSWGLSATQVKTGQQWDKPNCWPPLVQMAVEAIINLEDQALLSAIKCMTDKYIFACTQAYNRLGALPEKSNSLISGSCGSGGDYKCQIGFGWSIGVALELLFAKRGTFCAREMKERRRKFGYASYVQALQAAHKS